MASGGILGGTSSAGSRYFPPESVSSISPKYKQDDEDEDEEHAKRKRDNEDEEYVKRKRDGKNEEHAFGAPSTLAGNLAYLSFNTLKGLY